MSPSKFMTTAEVAARLGITRQAVHRRVQRGTLAAAVRTPAALLFLPAEVAKAERAAADRRRS